MALKRDIDSLVYSDTEETPAVPSNKRQRKQTNKGKQQRQPAVDPTYGQKCAFPVLDGLDTPSDDDLEFEDQTEALAYLRSVQQETSRIPHVVVAPKAGPQLPPGYILPSSHDSHDGPDRAIYQNGIGDSRGYYHDGAYTAVPDHVPTDSEDGQIYGDDDDPDPDPTAANRAALSEAYFASLTARFTALRTLLHRDPPAAALAALPPEHETWVGSFGPNKPTFRMWTHRVRYTDPIPAQVAAMDKASVLRLLRVVLGGKFFRRGCALRRRTSRWLWALLARLPERGRLDAEDVGAVRELGKRAVLVSIAREQVVALCEVLGRDQVEAFGLRGVLHEIEGRTGERRVGLDEDGEEDDLPVDDGDSRLASDLHGDAQHRDGMGSRRNGIEAAAGADVDLEAGELPDESEAVAEPQTANTDAALNLDLDLEDGELPEENEAAPEQQTTGTDADPIEDGEMDMDLEDGEISDEAEPDSSNEAAMAAIKARLLSELDDMEAKAESPERPSAAETNLDDPLTELVNMRATVNMILTVAGEFYGQRDLLAFRDPFEGVPLEAGTGDE